LSQRRTKAVPIPPNSQYDEGEMRKPIHITAPWPTPEEMERQFPIPKARQRELQMLVDEFKATISNREEVPVNSSEPEKRRKRASAA
jgi:hypothetical protein